MTSYTYAHTPFSISWTNANTGGWEKNAVEVFRDGVRIGGYWRNYGMVAKTFCPFRVGDTWYALYSEDYTATRVARLSDTFEDWCGEEPSGMGFCPVEFWVPQGYTNSFTYKDEIRHFTSWFDSDYKTEEEFAADAANKPQVWATHGYVSGCYWGDDSSWKLRYVDLSQVENKIITIEERFGYWELADGMGIRKSIRIQNDAADSIRLTGSFRLDLKKSPPSETFHSDFFSKD